MNSYAHLKYNCSNLAANPLLPFIKASVTGCNFSFNLSRNTIAGRLQRVTCSLCNSSCNFSGIATVAQNNLVLDGAIFLEICLATLGNRKPIASCRRHVTRCNLELQLAMVSKQSMQSLQKLEQSSTLCNCSKPRQVAKQVAKRVCYMLQVVCCK